MASPSFILQSSAFEEGNYIPMEYTCEGDDSIPPLQWDHVPDDTQSYAMIVDDPDAPNGTFTHWVIFDVPPHVVAFPADGKKAGISGKNDFDRSGYDGPCPQENHGDHRYYFKLFALDVKSLKLEHGVDRNAVEQAMEGHILDQTHLVGLYRRE